MQKVTAKHRLEDLIGTRTWFSVEDLLTQTAGPSKRSALRLIESEFGKLVSDLSEVRDGYSRKLNQLVVPEMRKWLNSKRSSVRILQLVADETVLASVDLRGHAEFIGLGETLSENLTLAISQIPGSKMLVPHASVHEQLWGRARVGSHEILECAHYPLDFVPPTQTERGGFDGHNHLWDLEQQAIQIFREAMAAAENPAMLFSMGKDSMVMLRLAEKAFAPEPIPFPLVIIDTRWKFQEMYSFRRWLQERQDLNVIVHVNPEAIERDVNPFDFGSATHTDITKTQALKQILDEHNFDFVFGGARRDEEKSRAKERIFSVRDESHGWDPKNQRPELWDYYNTTLVNGQSMRVFPLSNWTELDIWRYLEVEAVPLVPLYFSRRRPYVVRNGSLIMVNDERFRLRSGEKVHFDPIRFRTLGCYPLTGGAVSDAGSVPEIVQELMQAKLSERSSRVIDFDRGASMEQKKREGYF